MIDNKFKIVRSIGKGCSSEVFWVEDAYQNKAAIKAIRNDQNYEPKTVDRLLKKEHEVASMLANHPNVVNSFTTNLDGQYSFRDRIENVKYNVLELAENGGLAHYIMLTGGIEEQITKFYFVQLGDVLKTMHSQGWAHLDVKLENLLLDEFFNIKLGDFGSAEKVKKTKGLTSARRGTPQYMAPEVRDLKRGEKYDAYAADIYCLGVTLYLLLVGEFPPGLKELDNMEVGESETTDSISPSNSPQKTQGKWASLSKSVKTLLNSMLDSDPEKRPSIKQVCMNVWMQTQLPEDITTTTYQEMQWRKFYIKKFC